jgi:hypothetical protein
MSLSGAPASQATPSFPPDLPPHRRRYFHRQAAADEKREKQLMRDGLLRPADYRYYPRNPLIPRAKTPSAPESPTLQPSQSQDPEDFLDPTVS